MMTFIILLSIIFKANEIDITRISNLRNYMVSQGSPCSLGKMEINKVASYISPAKH